MEKSAIRLAFCVFVFAAFAAAAIYGPWGARRIEALVKNDVDSRLAAAGLDWAGSEVDGRNVRLSGSAPDEEAIEAARAAAGAPGVARIDISGVESTAMRPESPLSEPETLATPETEPASGESEPASSPVEIESPPTPTLAECRTAINRALAGRRITFLTSSVRLSLSDRAVLDDLVEALAGCHDFIVTIEGHTDASGSPRTNQALSEQRARIVLAYLRERAPAANLVMRGYGETRPIASNRTQEGRRANRRIDFVASVASEGETQAQ